jgi:hypothetical protein
MPRDSSCHIVRDVNPALLIIALDHRRLRNDPEFYSVSEEVYAIGDRVCAITEWSMMQKMHSTQPMLLKEGYVVTTNVREGR